MWRIRPSVSKPVFGRFGTSLMRSPRSNLYMRRFNSTQAKPEKKPSGIKALMKEYGYAGLGVYLALTAIDLPIFYVLVHSMGQEEIEYYENKVKQKFGYGISDEELQKKQEINKIHEEVENEGVPKPQNDSLWSTLRNSFSWTEFAIAYGIHKSFIFVRLPIAAAITPGIVKTLRRWGFRIGTDKLATTANIAKEGIKDFTAGNPKFGSRPNSKKRWFSWFF
ncbi:N-terminal acetyltransferase 2 [Meyerozyma sp. JA9]|nr:N-terminal acetyltransferase 2 [Meyerozyma sp. JA9]